MAETTGSIEQGAESTQLWTSYTNPKAYAEVDGEEKSEWTLLHISVLVFAFISIAYISFKNKGKKLAKGEFTGFTAGNTPS